MRTLVVLMVLLLGGQCVGQSIEGPDEVVAYRPAWFKIKGLPPTASLLIWPSPVITIDSELVQRDAILFWSTTLGEYKIHAAICEGGIHTPLVKTVKVVESTNDDEDDGNGPPPPIVDAKWQVKLFTDKDQEDNWPLEQVAILNGLKFRDELNARGHQFLGSVDISQRARASWPTKMVETCVKDRYGREQCVMMPKPVPPETVGDAWWGAVEGDPLPRIAVMSKEGGAVQDFDLPGNKEDVFTLLETTKP